MLRTRALLMSSKIIIVSCVCVFIWQVAPRLKERLVRAGSFLVGYQPMPDKGLVNFFRMVTTCYQSQPSHMDRLLDEMDSLGADL